MTEDLTDRAARVEDSLAELSGLRHLQEFSARLIRENEATELHEHILTAAIGIMRSSMASMQLLDVETGNLRLLASRGFHPESAAHWARVPLDSDTCCGKAGASTGRVIFADVETSPALAGTADLREYRRSGIRACQSTPLLSRAGNLLGMVSTHWHEPHQPTEDDLRLFDLLARQVADIVERTATETALRESEQRYRGLFDSIDEGFCVLEIIFDEQDRPVDYRFLEVNPCFEKQTGLINAVGKTVRDLAPGLEAHWFETYGKVAVTGESVRFQNHAAALGRWYDVFAYRFGAPAQRQVAVLFNDITVRRQHEDALRASEEFKRSIIESSPDCIKVLDLEGRLLSMETGQKLLGITDITPLLGKSWLDFWGSEADAASAREAIAKAVAGGEGKFVGFFRTLRGEEKWWDVVVTPILAAGDQPARLLAVSRDVTEARQAEKLLQAHAAELARADRSKNEFLAMLAHELRNPLAPLRNASEILKSDGVSEEERAQAQRIIDRQIENMGRMIDDLLDVSRITEGKIELQTKAVSIETILHAAASLVGSTCAARQQELKVSLPAEPIYVHADATRLEQVFGNLLGNASKYSGEGCRIELSAERDGGEIVVRVIDNGSGIAPELLPRVFDLFVQASRTLDRAHGGLGIGLTLVQRLVKLHGGSVEARSEGLDQGSEFIVRLPIILHEVPAPAPAVPRPTAATAAASRRILIVDDNSDSARSLAVLQNRRGHLTRTAFTGPDALTAAEEFRPEIVLLDIGLPGMDGFEVARKIRALPELSGAFIVAMSGYGRDEDHVEAKLAGFNEYLVKPIDLDRLQEWLRER